MKNQAEIQPMPSNDKPWGLISIIGLALFALGWMVRSMID